MGGLYAAFMAKGDWPTSYVIPSLALSGTAAGFLVWHVIDPAAKVDGWAITLLVVAFLPWLRTVFESIEFPGGGSVTWRQKVEAEQQRQAEEIQALRFLLARFITPPERELLQQLASGEGVPLDNDGDNRWAFERAKSLRRLGLIAVRGRVVKSAQSESVNVEQLFYVTESGRQLLTTVENPASRDGVGSGQRRNTNRLSEVSSVANRSAGQRSCSTIRGRLLSSSSTALRCCGEWLARVTPFGK